jgi:hypothetical protein
MAKYRIVHDLGYEYLFNLQKLFFGFWWRTIKVDTMEKCELYIKRVQNPVVKEY